MDSFFSWTATALTTYLAGFDVESDTPTNDGTDASSQDGLEHEFDVFTSSTSAQSFDQSAYLALASPPLPGGFPVSPRSPTKRRARHQHGSPKRQKICVEAYKPGSSSTGIKKKRHGNAKSSSKDLEARVKARLPHRARSTPSTPLSHGKALVKKFSSIEDIEPDVQAVPYSTLDPNSPSHLVGATSGQGQPWPLVADNVVIGRKRPAPAEFDEEVSVPHRKKYITGWMSEYIRLRASSWHEMLKVMREARWRPFRPQCTILVTRDPPVPNSTAPSANRAEFSPPSPTPSPEDPSSSLPATTTPTYSPPESPLPITPPSFLHLEVEAVTPPDTPSPHSSVAYPLAWSAQDCVDSFPSAFRIPWADKGKWRADADREQSAYRLDSIATEDPIPAATDLPPFLLSTSPSPVSLPPSPPAAPPSSFTPTISSYPFDLPTIRTDRPRPVSNSKQSRVRLEGLRRLKSTRLEPTKFAHLRLMSQVKWHLQEICRRKRIADRSVQQVRTNLPSPLAPPPLTPTPSTLTPLSLTPSSLVPLPASQRICIPRAAVPTSKRLKAVKRDLRFKNTRPNPCKMGYLRLRSEVKWRLKDLGFEKRPVPPPPAPAISTPPDEVIPFLVRIGSMPVLIWPASVFNSPPAPVAPTPLRNDWDNSTRLSVLASLDSPKRAYRPKRRRRLVLDQLESMEDVELSGPSP